MTSFIKQQVSTVTNRWGDDEVKDVCLCCMLMKTVAKMDPVRGDWCVNGNEMKVWIDASSVATGVTKSEWEHCGGCLLVASI